MLLAQRLEPEFLAGKWEFPGGKVESNESKLEALHREIYEELNITLNSVSSTFSWRFVTTDRVLNFHAFSCSDWQGEIKLSEHSAMAWVTLEELLSWDLPDADLPLAHYLIGQKVRNS